MFVVLSGHVAITQRDGLGHVTPVIDQGPGQFLAEIGQLSGRVALVDGHAEGDVETLLIPPERLRALLVAEADLGERIMRALILRRVSLIQGGAGGPVLIGPANSQRRDPPAGLSHPQRLSASSARSGQPTRDAAELIARYSPLAGGSGRWWWRPTARCCAIPRESELARAMGMIARARQGQDLRCRRRRQRPGRTVDRGVCGLRRAWRSRCATRARSAARPAPARGSRITSAFPTGISGHGADGARLQPGAEIRRRHDDPGRR